MAIGGRVFRCALGLAALRGGLAGDDACEAGACPEEVGLLQVHAAEADVVQAPGKKQPTKNEQKLPGSGKGAKVANGVTHDGSGDRKHNRKPQLKASARVSSRPSRVSGGGDDTCADVPDWVDYNGFGCDSYVAGDYCAADGGLGPAWVAAWGTLEDYSKDGYSAATACCGCGRGTVCQNHPETWQDSDEDYCSDYKKWEWCTPEGDYGAGWSKSWGSFHDYAVKGKTALHACCACGGPAKLPRKPAQPSCRHSESRWTDGSGDDGSSGYSCSNYVQLGWCTASGGYGENWDLANWGSFDNWRNPDENCCGCGGGVTCKPACAYCEGFCAALGGETESCKRHCKAQFGKINLIMGRYCHGGVCSEPASDDDQDGCSTKAGYCESLCSAFSGCTLGMEPSECPSTCMNHFGDLENMFHGYCVAGLCHGSEADEA